MKWPDFKSLILFEDKHFLLAGKPAFISTLEDRNDPHSLIGLAKAYHPDLQAGHRLDKETSGVIAFAKDPLAYRHLSIQFEKRRVDKTYHALADGLHEFRDHWVDAPILTLNNGLVRIAREGKQARTRFSTLEAYKWHSLIECKPITGRMHQIRIHLAHLKAPITGDDSYGGKPLLLSQIKRNYNLKKFEEEQPIIKRVALHAYSLRFEGLQGEEITATAPYPKDFAVAVKQLKKNV